MFRFRNCEGGATLLEFYITRHLSLCAISHDNVPYVSDNTCEEGLLVLCTAGSQKYLYNSPHSCSRRNDKEEKVRMCLSFNSSKACHQTIDKLTLQGYCIYDQT